MVFIAMLWLLSGWRSKSSFPTPLQALGEGESREDFVRVEGTQVRQYEVSCLVRVFYNQAVAEPRLLRSVRPRLPTFLCGWL